jgi:hypothetical protein
MEKGESDMKNDDVHPAEDRGQFDLNKFKVRNAAAWKAKAKAGAKAKPRRKSKDFAHIPAWWIPALAKARCIGTVPLALRILAAASGRNEIVLTSEMTGLSRTIRAWAAAELVQFRLIEVERKTGCATKVLHVRDQRKSRRSPDKFEVEFLQVPLWWIGALGEARCIGTGTLALKILAADFKNEHCSYPKETVLSSEMTGMPHTTRIRVIRELVRLGLIGVEQMGNQAPRVFPMYRRIIDLS